MSIAGSLKSRGSKADGHSALLEPRIDINTPYNELTEAQDFITEDDLQSRKRQWAIMIISLIVSLPFFIWSAESEDSKALQMGGMTIIMGIWWLTEPVPLPVTSLLPIILFPLFEIVSGDDICKEYFNDSSFVFIGSGLLAVSVEKWDLHRRIALTAVSLTGTKPEYVLLAFIGAASFLSMWIANTSTALIMMPMAIAVINRMHSQCSDEVQSDAMETYGRGLIFAVTYATSIGGTGTLTGTAPQLLFTGQLETLFPESPKISFLLWSSFALPMVIVFDAFLWVYLVRFYVREKREFIPRLDMEVIVEQLDKMGPLKDAEKRILIVFSINIALWFFREPDFMPGWAWTEFITDSTIVVASAVALYLIPEREGSKKGILTLQDLKSLPWDIYIILGGGFALSRGFEDSGLSEIIGDFLVELDVMPPFWILFFVCLFMATLTEFTSNTAASALFLPIVAQMCIGIEIDPRFLMVPTTITASYAFMFPVATGPNGVAYSTGMITVRQMAVTGFPLNVVGVFLITCSMYTLGNLIYGIEVGEIPSWALPE